MHALHDSEYLIALTIKLLNNKQTKESVDNNKIKKNLSASAFAYRPLKVRWEHMKGQCLCSCGIYPLPRDPEVLVKAAIELTNLSDFGNPSFIEGFKVLHHSLITEAGLHYVGEKMMKGMLLTHLCNRLQIEQSLKETPAILDEIIERPIFIIGMPRTGSTFLQRLMASDPSTHHLRFAEALTPAPSPAVYEHMEHIRMDRANIFCRTIDKYGHGLQAMHAITPDSPEECYFLLRNSFMHPSFQTSAPIPSYINWVASQGQIASYQDYKRQLQILQYGQAKKRWVLKSISHWSVLPLLLKTFPDAHIVQMHRHPRAVIPSFTALMASARAVCSNKLIEPSSYVRSLMTSLSRHLDKLHKFRASLPSEQQSDVYYHDLVHDPITTVRSLYDNLGLPYSRISEKSMNDYLNDNKKEKRSNYRYSPEMFGLSGSDIDIGFSKYLSRYKLG